MPIEIGGRSRINFFVCLNGAYKRVLHPVIWFKCSMILYFYLVSNVNLQLRKIILLIVLPASSNLSLLHPICSGAKHWFLFFFTCLYKRGAKDSN
jgi:hypothetical protein